jgi:hypothetical protein
MILTAVIEKPAIMDVLLKRGLRVRRAAGQGLPPISYTIPLKQNDGVPLKQNDGKELYGKLS